METKLEKEVRFLKIYALIATLFCAVLFLSGFVTQNKKQKFEEIDVERINVLDKDGKLRMVISNKDRQHPGIAEGKVIDRERKVAGILFFDQVGDECGGLLFDENGGKGHFVSLTYDKVHHSETMRLQHLESDDGQYSAGLEIWDRANLRLSESLANWERIKKMPEGAEKQAAMKRFMDNGEDGAQRIVVKKLRDKTALISLADTKGKPRIKMSVAPDGTPKLDFLDENGKVTYSLPTSSSTTKQ
ncbi:MAG: hypothetical protein WBP93_04440 [Pyrinomonadaceae bacterium]